MTGGEEFIHEVTSLLIDFIVREVHTNLLDRVDLQLTKIQLTKFFKILKINIGLLL